MDSTLLRLRLLTIVFAGFMVLASGSACVPFLETNPKIAFSSQRDGNNEIYMMNADGTEQTNLTTNGAANDVEPTFSPDGSKIAFTSVRGSGETNTPPDPQIYVMNADGTNQSNLTPHHNNSRTDAQPAFSPDGEKIAFVSDQDGDYRGLTTTTSSRTRRDLDTLLYPSTVGCNPCYLTLRGISCGETGLLSLGALHRAARFLALLC